MRLSSAATREFGHYVYLFVDPRDNSIFYVGQGKGSRALRHLDDRRESRKVDRIREIRKAGKEPRIEILVHGLKDEETAFRIEAAVIDLIGVRSLTNAVRGRHVAEYGRREIRELVAFYKRVPVRVRLLLIPEGAISARLAGNLSALLPRIGSAGDTLTDQLQTISSRVLRTRSGSSTFSFRRPNPLRRPMMPQP